MNGNDAVLVRRTARTRGTLSLVVMVVLAGLSGCLQQSSPPVPEETALALSEPASLSRRIATSSDDAEEKGTGSVNLSSSDLELVTDGSRQTVGMRFTDIQIPPGSVVESAYIQFRVDERTSTRTSLTIRGQAADHAATFRSTARDISSRPMTDARVTWAPGSWGTVGAAGSAQRTPDLDSLVQEVVSRPAWKSGNALVFIVTGSGKRVAESYNGSRAAAAQLTVTFRAPEAEPEPEPEPPPVPAPGGLTEAFSIIALPDTQNYVKHDGDDDYLLMLRQVQWIVDNLDARDISFVTHEGDVVDRADKRIEWERADAAMDLLDGRVPYSVAMGDHDYYPEELRSGDTRLYREFFGPSRYAAYSWYRGSAPNGLGHYQVIEAGGQQFLHLAVEWEAPGPASDPNTPLGWARQVLERHATIPTIITTHSYLWDKSGYEGWSTAIQENERDGTSGKGIYQALVRPHDQVFMVLNGHWHRGSGTSEGEWHQVSTNDAGSKVYEMLANYQGYPNGGDGWLREIRFLPGGGAGGLDRIQVQTYSPVLEAYQTDSRSAFRFDLSFAERFDLGD